MPTIKVNGREIDAPSTQTLLPTLLDNDTYVPHYCWHRGLSPDGNCRMCLVKVSTSRKLEVACMTRPSEKMEVVTEGPEIDAARKAVLEYMLVNHPLDCPICDKAGECDLQDFTFTYRDGVSRFVDDKTTKGTVDLGPNVKIWGNRCIACTRCVRFCEEIVGTAELTIVNRGDHSVAGINPGVPLDNPMSLNVVDLCPVGALIDKNFLFQARVWFAQKTPTVCGSCAKGCNIDVTSLAGHVKRMKPRVNLEVNQYWMCDAGRLGWRWIESPERAKVAKGDLRDAARRLVDIFDHHGPGSIGILASTGHTLEEFALLRQLADGFGAVVGLFGRMGPEWTSASGWRIEPDKTPNTKGAQEVFGGPMEADVVYALAAGGKLQALLVLNALPDHHWSDEMIAAAARVPLTIVGDVWDGPLARQAQVVWPLASWLEKFGTFVNVSGHVQPIRPAVAPPGMARSEAAWLQDLLLEIGLRGEILTDEELTREVLGARLDVPTDESPNRAGSSSPTAEGVR
jgi:NADH-quinone oxidoreductase subunit G